MIITHLHFKIYSFIIDTQNYLFRNLFSESIKQAVGGIEMSTLGIISEYNPYHNGHAYLLESAKEMTGSAHAVSIMSGPFSQQGLPMVQDKYVRAAAAAASGIDLVFELPVLFATGSAGDFAEGAVALLTRSHLVDTLCFGVETPDESIFSEAADCILEEPDPYKDALRQLQKEGLSYPSAREKALTLVLGQKIHDLVGKPNNILALEYILAIRRLRSPLKICMIRRTTDYHGAVSDLSSPFIHLSATEIRKKLLDQTPADVTKSNIPSCLRDGLPEEALNAFQKAGFHFLLSPAGLMPYLAMRMLELPDELPPDSLPMGMTQEMYHRLKKLSPPMEYEEAIEALKRKNVTRSRITRSLLHLILDIRESDRIRDLMHAPLYLNLLSAREESTGLLRTPADTEDTLPVITKKASWHPTDHRTIRLWSLDLKAELLYNQIFYDTCRVRNKPAYCRSPVIVPTKN